MKEPHQKLWEYLAEKALDSLNFKYAEKAFSLCKDFAKYISSTNFVILTKGCSLFALCRRSTIRKSKRQRSMPIMEGLIRRRRFIRIWTERI